jgi:hypothetical protein
LSELDGLLNQKFWADRTFWHKTGSWRNFAVTSLETLNTKVIANELSILLVTHMVSSDVRFDSYGVLNLGHSAELFWTD